MKSPNTKAVNMVTRCDSFRLQKATTNNSQSGAGCHKRQGKSEIIQIKIRVNQMKNRPDGRLKGDGSMGCSAPRPEGVGAAIWGLLSGLRSMVCGLRGFRGRDIDPQDQKMAVPFGVRQRRGNRLRKARCDIPLYTVNHGDRQAGRKQAADSADRKSTRLNSSH